MKTIFSFCYCEGVITPEVVIYSVTVGVSERDRQARRYLNELARKNINIFWHRHDLETSRFFGRVDASFLGATNDRSFTHVQVLRKKQVAVTWLASFLKKCPALLLNSDRIDTTMPARVLFGESRPSLKLWHGF